MSALLNGLVPLLRRPVGAADRERAALHLLDWLGCAAYGSATPAGRVFADYFNATRSAGAVRALTVGAGDWQSALLCNGALGNIAEMDDVHRESILHPGPVVIPAALAVAQWRGADALSLLDAIVRGYEAVIRIGRALGPSHYRFWHNTSTCGAFGAAAAVCALLDLTDTQWVWALANAGTRTGGLWQMRHEHTFSKQYHNALAALSGAQAALLARSGLFGPTTLLEGAQGLFAATSPDAEPARVLDGPDDAWLLWRCSFKPWPACRHTHPAIDAALAFDARWPLSAIAGIEIETYADALRFCDCRDPRTESQAKFSLQHALAVVLQRGRPTLADFQETAVDDDGLRRLRALCRVRDDEAFSAAYPRHWGARLRITLANGESHERAVHDALGDPELPLSIGQVQEKARALLTAAGFGAEPAARLIESVSALPATLSLDALWNNLP